MTTIKCVGFSKGLVPADRYQRFRLEQPSFGISGLEPDGAPFKMCLVPRVWLHPLGTSDLDSGPDPPMVRRSNVSGSEGLVLGSEGFGVGPRGFWDGL